MKPHILHIISGLQDGGAEAVLDRLMGADNDYRHTVLSFSQGGKYADIFKAKGHTVHMLDGVMSPSGLSKLTGLIKDINPDTIQTWMPHANVIGGVAAKLAGFPQIVWGIHNTKVGNNVSWPTRFLIRFAGALSYFVPAQIICCANSSRSAHIEMGYKQSKLDVVFNGFDTDKFKINAKARKRVRGEFGFTQSDLVLGTVARFDRIKDHPTIIAALGLLKTSLDRDFKVMLIGTHMDSDNEALVALLKSADILDNTILCGPRFDIPDIMNALDIHILGSMSEAFPNVIGEAMACGTSCVSTDVGDAAFMISQTGEICPPKDKQALHKAIGKQVSRLAQEDLGPLARKRISENFSVAVMARGYKRVWESL